VEQILTERKEREKLSQALEVERERRAKDLEVLAKELEIERERSAKELIAVKAEADKRVLDFITSSSYKGLRDAVEVRNKEEASK
jgi:hypothetical protein